MLFLQKLAHVPKEILLIDDTIRRNIAFGIADDEVMRRISSPKYFSLDKVIKTFKKD